MPQNKRESLIFTIIMCFTMVLWMSMYNVTLHMGGFSMTVLKEGWLGFPFAYIYAMCFDWFVVSHLAKSVAFRFFVKPDSAPLKKAIAVSCCMVVPSIATVSKSTFPFSRIFLTTATSDNTDVMDAKPSNIIFFPGTSLKWTSIFSSSKKILILLRIASSR